MEVKHCVSASKRSLSDARRYLDKGKAVTLVPDSLQSGLQWAMEAWWKAYDLYRGGSWEDIRVAFWNAAPQELRSEVMYCLHKATLLEYDLEGGLDYKEPIPPIDVLKKAASACLERTEKILTRMLKELGQPHA